MTETDVLIIGAGAAGMTAAMYAERANLDVILLDQRTHHGDATENEHHEHYIKFGGVTADEMVSRIGEQLNDTDIRRQNGVVSEVFKGDRAFHVDTDGGKILAKAVIVATGANPRSLMVSGEHEFMGKGLSYCAVCEAPAYKDKDVVVIGGGDDAMDAAAFMSRLAHHVTVVHDRSKPDAGEALLSKVKQTKNISIKDNCRVMGFMGGDRLERVIARDQNTGETLSIPAEGAFIHVGFVANSRFLKGTCDLDAYGFVITDRNLETDVKGLFACGDVIAKSYRYLVTAISDGAVAAMNAIKYIDLYF